MNVSIGSLTIRLEWQLDPVLIGSLVALVTAYALVTGPLRSRFAPGEPYPTGKALWFYGGIVLLYLLEGSPLHDLAERYSFTAHMGQHIGLSYLAAPMLIHGTPTWVLRPLLLNRAVRPLARLLTRPLVALIVFNVAFSAWHFPAIYEGALQNATLHHAEHIAFLALALLLWWPLMSPLPELPRPSYLVQLVYIFVIPIAQLPVSALLTFGDSVFYPTYAAAPWNLGLSAIQDQTLGGLVMKVGGFVAMLVPFTIVFFRWYRDDTRGPRSPERDDPALAPVATGPSRRSDGATSTASTPAPSAVPSTDPSARDAPTSSPA